MKYLINTIRTRSAVRVSVIPIGSKYLRLGSSQCPPETSWRPTIPTTITPMNLICARVTGSSKIIIPSKAGYGSSSLVSFSGTTLAPRDIGIVPKKLPRAVGLTAGFWLLFTATQAVYEFTVGDLSLHPDVTRQEAISMLELRRYPSSSVQSRKIGGHCCLTSWPK